MLAEMRAAVKAAAAKYSGPDFSDVGWDQPRDVQQLTCETRQFCGGQVTYELHCFLGPLSPSPDVCAKYQQCIDLFNEHVSCDGFKMKGPVIGLRLRPTPSVPHETFMHVMQSSRYIKAASTNDAMELLRLNKCFWNACGFSVVRAKLEATAQTCDLPSTWEEAQQFKAYFESHIKVTETSDTDALPTVEFMRKLCEWADAMSAQLGWPVCVAYNAAKDPQLLSAISGGTGFVQSGGRTGQLFVNHRMRGVTWEENKTRQNYLLAELVKQGWMVVATVSEVVVFETTPLGDRGGFDPATSTVLLVSGKRYTGKTTFVQELRRQLLGIQVNEVTIATPGKAEYCMREMVDSNGLRDRKAKEEYHRKGMQDLMSEMSELHPKRFVWPALAKIAELEEHTSSVIVVSDIRRKSEWVPLRLACERMVGTQRVLSVRLDMSDAEAEQRGRVWNDAVDTHITETDLDDLHDVWDLTRTADSNESAAQFARRVIDECLKPVMWQ